MEVFQNKTKSQKNMVNIFTLWLFNVGQDFTSEKKFFCVVKLTKNSDPEKFKYFGCGIGFDARGSFSLSNGSGFVKNVIIFGANMSSLVHTDNKKKYILVLVKGTRDGLVDTMLTAEKDYSINFTEQQKKFCLSFHYNGVNGYIFVIVFEIYNF